MNRRVAKAIVVGVSSATFIAGCSSSTGSNPSEREPAVTTAPTEASTGRPFPDTIGSGYEALDDLETRVAKAELVRFSLGKCVYWQNTSEEGEPWEWVVINNPAHYSAEPYDGTMTDPITSTSIPYFAREEIYLSGFDSMYYGVPVVYSRSGSRDAKEEMGYRLYPHRAALKVIEVSAGSTEILESVSQTEEGWVTESGIAVMQRNILPATMPERDVSNYCAVKSSENA